MCYVSTLHIADVLLFILLYSATGQPPNIFTPYTPWRYEILSLRPIWLKVCGSWSLANSV